MSISGDERNKDDPGQGFYCKGPKLLHLFKFRIFLLASLNIGVCNHKMTQNQPLTDFAQIYAHPQGQINGIDHRPIKSFIPYKSGLTPLGSPSIQPSFDAQIRQTLEEYQRERLAGQ